MKYLASETGLVCLRGGCKRWWTIIIAENNAEKKGWMVYSNHLVLCLSTLNGLMVWLPSD